ncbi:MAG: hypothetical protein JWR50_3057 [Mucilaginibacter sp.]|nr:hypothetical protein [Mucilaginibacter sp.]
MTKLSIADINRLYETRFIFMLRYCYTAQSITSKKVEPTNLNIKPSAQEVDRNSAMDILISVPGTPRNEVFYKINLTYYNIDGNEYLKEIATSNGITTLSTPLLINIC